MAEGQPSKPGEPGVPGIPHSYEPAERDKSCPGKQWEPSIARELREPLEQSEPDSQEPPVLDEPGTVEAAETCKPTEPNESG